MKYLKTFEENKYDLYNSADITYDEVIETSKYENDIRKHLVDYYPSSIYQKYASGGRRKVSEKRINDILKLAKKNKDEKLIELVYNYIKYLDDFLIRKDSNKYNL